MHTLGIDIGTSGVRSSVLDTDTGLEIATARASHPQSRGDWPDAEDWWTAVCACITAQLQDLRDKRYDPAEVGRICIDGTSGSMVLTDEGLAPVGPALMYNSKGFTDEAQKIAQHAPDPHITQGSNSALARAMRLVTMAHAKPTFLLHQADFIAARLLGHGGFSDHNNALKTGFDPETERWPDWIGEVIEPALLPVAKAPGSDLEHISAKIADSFGLSRRTRIMAGTTDSIAAFLAAAPMEEGIAVTSLGSTLAIKLLTKARIDAPEMGLYSHRIGDLWLVGGASNTGGAVLANHFSNAQLSELSTKIDPSKPSGLDYYPLLQPGERFPVNDPSLMPCLEPRPSDDAEFLQGIFEGIARIEARCYEAIVAQGGPRPIRILTAGGGAQNPIWNEIRRAALGTRVDVAPQGEACLGAAKLAASLQTT